MAIHGISNPTEGVMGETRNEIKRLKQEAIARNQAATSADKMAVAVNKEVINAGIASDASPAAKEAALTEAKRVVEKSLTDEQKTTLAKAAPEQVIGIVKTAIDGAVAKIVAALREAVKTFYMNAESKLVTRTQKDEMTAKLTNYFNQGNQLSFAYDMMFETVNGVSVPRVGAAMIFDALSKSTAKTGAIQIISAGQNAVKAEEALAMLYPDLGDKVKANAGNEKSLIDAGLNPALLRVLFSDDSQVAKIDKVTYIKGKNLDQVNGLQVLIAALAVDMKSLTASEQALLLDLGNGTFELQNVGIADDVYESMLKEHEIVKGLLIKA
jgi:hypothetical protein